jgi:choline monooxygenase
LEPAVYRDANHFAREQPWLRDNCWHFVCLKREIDRPNGYATAEIGGAAITVENTRVGLAAFRNVCSHRLARLRMGRVGAEPFVCPYHGWTYDEEGVPSRIPFNDGCFHLSEENRRGLALPRYRVGTCGEFVFVAHWHMKQSLSDYLGPEVSEFLERLSGGFCGNVRSDELEISANWKLAIENAMDPIHSPFIHRTTFGAIATLKVDDKFYGPHSWYLMELKPDYLARLSRIERFIPNRPFRVDGYLHLHVFPYLSIGTNMGLTCMIQNIEPRAAAVTNLMNRYVDMELTGPGERVGPQIDAIRSLADQFTTTIGTEDREIVERVQLGLSDAFPPTGLLGSNERRISHFHRQYAMAAERFR